MSDIPIQTTLAELGKAGWRANTAHAVAVAAVLLLAAGLGLSGLAQRYDLQAYDEGVYWETLRAMSAGQELYSQIFLSQPPAFVLSIYPFYQLLGGTIAAARLGLVVYALLGLVGAYLSGLQLSGRSGGLIALLLAASAKLQLVVPRHLEAEGPANGLLFLALAAALWWWRYRHEARGMLLFGLAAVLVTVGSLIKLLDVTGFALLAFMLATALIRDTRRSKMVPRLVAAAAVAAAATLLAAAITLAPFAPAWPQLYQQAVQFHLDARHAYPLNLATNARIIVRHLIEPSAALCALALVGLVAALWRRDPRGLFLGGWLVVSGVLLLNQTPLFPRHAVVLLPPLIALSALAIEHLAGLQADISQTRRARRGLLISAVLVASATISGFVEQANFIASETQISQRDQPVLESLAGDLSAKVRRDQWVITDQQLAAAIADRDTPPHLVDTSWVRIDSGFLTTPELCAAVENPRTAAVLFSTWRLSSRRVAGFRGCVAQHFVLFRDYGRGNALWLRRDGSAAAPVAQDAG